MTAWTARNPLGIIALFISLIYGMSALLLGTTVGTLSPTNQTILVWFVVVFPVAVRLAFLWLVAKHHRKLYSPADFRSDEGFLAEPAEPRHLGAKFDQEVRQIEGEAAPLPPADSEAPTAPVESDAGSQAGRASASNFIDTNSVDARRSAVATAYVAESLAFRELEEEFRGSVRQHVRVSTAAGRYMEIDGLIETSNVTYIVEVKLFRSTASIRSRIRQAVNQIERIYNDHDALLPNTKGLLVSHLWTN
jgi:hypothetical protein